MSCFLLESYGKLCIPKVACALEMTSISIYLSRNTNLKLMTCTWNDVKCMGQHVSLFPKELDIFVLMTGTVSELIL